MNSHVLMLQVLLEESSVISKDKHGMQIMNATAGGGREMSQISQRQTHTHKRYT